MTLLLLHPSIFATREATCSTAATSLSDGGDDDDDDDDDDAVEEEEEDEGCWIRQENALAKPP